MKPYPKYKPTNIDWIGKIPENWSLVCLKIISTIINGATPKSEVPEFWDGDIVWITPSDISRLKSIEINDSIRKISKSGLASCGTSLILPNTIILTCRAPIGNIAIAKTELCFNQGCKSIKVNGNPKYYFYYILSNSTVLESLGAGTTFKELSTESLKSFQTLVPPLPEQQAIVTYLDQKTALIDELIAKKERKIELLKENRTALINHAVTKGLDPTVKYKDSCIEWIGEIPEHWSAKRMKYLSDVVRGAILRPVDEPLFFDDNGEWTYLNISDVSKVNKYLEFGLLRLSELGSTKSRRIEPNNLIVTGSGSVGKVFINKIPVCVHDGFIPLLNLKANIDFMFYFLINPELYKGIGKTNSQKNIYLDEVNNIDVSLPPLFEQQQIVEYLDTQTSLIDQNINLELQKIEKLKEYRQSLISNVVTGKICVLEA